MPVAMVPIALENHEANEKNYKDDKKPHRKTPQTLILGSAPAWRRPSLGRVMVEAFHEFGR